MKIVLLAVLLSGVAVFLLSVRVIFGKRKGFLRGHACGFDTGAVRRRVPRKN